MDDSDALVRNQRIIIIILTVVLIISLLGAGSFAAMLKSGVDVVTSAIIVILGELWKIVGWILAQFGYSVGTVVNTTTNVAANGTIAGVELADGALNSVGDLFRRANEGNVNPELKAKLDELQSKSDRPFLPPVGGAAPATAASMSADISGNQTIQKIRADLDDVINKLNARAGTAAAGPAADTTASKIQTPNPVTTTSSQWCLIGEFAGRRGCIQIGPGEVCNSGQVFDSVAKCEGGYYNSAGYEPKK